MDERLKEQFAFEFSTIGAGQADLKRALFHIGARLDRIEAKLEKLIPSWTMGKLLPMTGGVVDCTGGDPLADLD